MRKDQYTLTEADAEAPSDVFTFEVPDTAFVRAINILDIQLVDTGGFIFTPSVTFNWRTRNIKNSGGQREIVFPVMPNPAGTVLTQHYHHNPLNVYTCKEMKTRDDIKSLRFELLETASQTPIQFEQFLIRFEIVYDDGQFYPEITTTNDEFLYRSMTV